MIDFALDETQTMIVETARAFARDVLGPRAREAEKARRVPADISTQFHELGIALLQFPEAVGGAGLDLVTATLVAEELGAGDPGLAAALASPGPAGRMIQILGSEEQRLEFLPPFAAGSRTAGFLFHPWNDEQDPAGIPFRFGEVGNGARVYGTLPLVAFSPADLYVVVARHESTDRLAAFIVEGEKLTYGSRRDTCGVEVMNFAGVTVDIHVPAARFLEGDIAAAVAVSLAEARLLTAARIVGAARAGNEAAVAYAQERQAFGKKIGQFQGLAFMLADAATQVDSARNLVQRGAWAFDLGRPDTAACAAAAAVHAYLAGDKVATDSLQTYGGNGFVQDYPLEKWMRDIRTLSLLWGARPQLDAVAVPADLSTWSDRT